MSCPEKGSSPFFAASGGHRDTGKRTSRWSQADSLVPHPFNFQGRESVTNINRPSMPGTTDSAGSTQETSVMTEITPTELSARIGSEDEPFVLDIRDEDEFENWHIPGSENIPVNDALKTDPETVKPELSEIPSDEEVVTVCAAGVVSKEATEQLREVGYDAKTLVDGMNGWSRVHQTATVPVDIDGTLVQVARPGKGCLSHILISDGKAVVFDPSQYVEEYEALLDGRDASLSGVYDTHAHADHVSGGKKLAQRHDVPYHLHPADVEDLDATPIKHGETFAVGNVEISVIHTPGHSPGSVTYAIEDQALLTGDTLFHESVGRVELGVEAGTDETNVEENAATLYESLQRVLARDGDPVVLPAHHPGSPKVPVTARLSEVQEQNADLNRPPKEFVATLSSDIPKHPPNFQRVKLVNMGDHDVPNDKLAELEVGPNRCAAE